jgi:hypothetical protein
MRGSSPKISQLKDAPPFPMVVKCTDPATAQEVNRLQQLVADLSDDIPSNLLVKKLAMAADKHPILTKRETYYPVVYGQTRAIFQVIK